MLIFPLQKPRVISAIFPAKLCRHRVTLQRALIVGSRILRPVWPPHHAISATHDLRFACTRIRAFACGRMHFVNISNSRRRRFLR
jgi:hypothetical protein